MIESIDTLLSAEAAGPAIICGHGLVAMKRRCFSDTADTVIKRYVTLCSIPSQAAVQPSECLQTFVGRNDPTSSERPESRWEKGT